MAKFVLIDQSFRGVGERRCQYALHIARAAEAAGYQVVLATHRRFRNAGLPTQWMVLRLFRQDQSRDLRRSPVWSWIEPCLRLAGLGALIDAARQRRQRGDFARGCAKLFQHIQVQAGDHVFLPAATQSDLLGLVQFLSVALQSEHADWHLQFHEPILPGRESGNTSRAVPLEAAQQLFQVALDQVTHHRLHFYAATDSLAAQYNRLGVADFRPLPYPVGNEFRQARPSAIGTTSKSGGTPAAATPMSAAKSALRVTYLDGGYKAKGHHVLSDFLSDSWQDQLTAHRVQLVVPLESSPHLPVPRHDRPHSKACDPQDISVREPVVYVSTSPDVMGDDYLSLIRRTDLALFLYESDHYQVRCCATLLDMLAAGIPVIVPAGCYLAEQIAEPIYRHLEQLPRQLPVIGQFGSDEIVWRQLHGTVEGAVGAARILTFGDALANVTGELPIPDGTREMLISFRWVRPADPSTYVRLQAEQYDADGNRLDRVVTIVGHRSSDRAVPMLIHIKRKTERVRLAWRNAYHHAPITVDDVQVLFLSVAGMPDGHCPAGAVGLIAADFRQARDHVKEMIHHYDHYRETAASFAQTWYADHDPQCTLAQLLAKATTSQTQSVKLRVA